MAKATSFICEHTAELALAPEIKKILREDYNHVTPIFPWMTREGGCISKSVHSQDIFEVIGFYPRRPKLKSEDEEVYLTINPELIDGVNEAKRHGIPIIAGVPIARNFWDLSEQLECRWINLEEVDSRSDTLINTTSPLKISELPDDIFFSSDDLRNYVRTNCTPMSLERLLLALREIKHQSMNPNNFFFGEGYKPVYVLLK